MAERAARETEQKNVGHLALTRRKGQSVRILVGGEEIVVSCALIKGKQVRLIFSAARSVQIVRSEVAPVSA